MTSASWAPRVDGAAWVDRVDEHHLRDAGDGACVAAFLSGHERIRQRARVANLVEKGRAALRVGDAAAARAAVEPLIGSDGRGDVLEILARADYLDLEFGSAIERWERAYAAHRAAGDQPGAIRVARTLSGMYGTIRGDHAVSSGWRARAQTLLERVGETSERGWVALNVGMFEPDRAAKNERLREALANARAASDTALEVATLAYLGASLVHANEPGEGMQLLDEALAALAGDEVDDFCVLEEVFCQLFSACEHARDVRRADQWIRMGEAIAARRNLPAVSAFCRTHYGGVLTAAGRWPEAKSALTDAVRLWGLGGRSTWLRGGALARLADLRVRQGRFEEAEQLLVDLGSLAARDAMRPRAAIHLAKGETELARDVLERALAAVPAGSAEAAPLLELLVDVALAAGDLPAAERTVEQLVATAAGHDGHYVRALAVLSRGRVGVATGSGDPQSCFREALNGFMRADAAGDSARPSRARDRAEGCSPGSRSRRGPHRPGGVRGAEGGPLRGCGVGAPASARRALVHDAPARWRTHQA